MAVVPMIVVHGGATGLVDDAKERTEGCAVAAELGLRMLQRSRSATSATSAASAIDAVEAAVRELENNPVFNAGKGSVLTADGKIELDASIMEGTTMKAGAVAALEGFANPITVARFVMADGRHVLMVGEGARAFARGAGFKEVDPKTLITDQALKRLQRWRESGQGDEPVSLAGNTVGAVAMDQQGRIAAGTSTGGITGQLSGRLGDTPIIGAGTYANDRLGGASCTGRGEAILRATMAKDAVDRCASEDASAAARLAISRLGNDFGGSGGIIVIDKNGAIGICHNTPTMGYAYSDKTGAITSGIVKS